MLWATAALLVVGIGAAVVHMITGSSGAARSCRVSVALMLASAVIAAGQAMIAASAGFFHSDLVPTEQAVWGLAATVGLGWAAIGAGFALLALISRYRPGSKSVSG